MRVPDYSLPPAEAEITVTPADVITAKHVGNVLFSVEGNRGVERAYPGKSPQELRHITSLIVQNAIVAGNGGRALEGPEAWAVMGAIDETARAYQAGTAEATYAGSLLVQSLGDLTPDSTHIKLG